jgi:V-type H+-transporting ATPase subunit C
MPSCQVSVEGVSPDQYLERFAWNEAKYPPRRPLAETVSAITETTQKLEDDLKACLPAHPLHAAAP